MQPLLFYYFDFLKNTAIFKPTSIRSLTDWWLETTFILQVKKEPGETEKLSKKKLRRMNRLSVAELKQLVARPDVVEMHDVTG